MTNIVALKSKPKTHAHFLNAAWYMSELLEGTLYLSRIFQEVKRQSADPMIAPRVPGDLKDPIAYILRVQSFMSPYDVFEAKLHPNLQELIDSAMLVARSPLSREEQWSEVCAQTMEKVRSAKHRRSVANFERSRYKNIESARNFISGLAASHSKLLVLRMDFYFHDNETNDGTGSRISAQDAKRHLEKLFKTLRSKLNGFVGYMWKMIYCVGVGYYFHVVFFLDGNIHREIQVGDSISRLWSNLTKVNAGHSINHESDPPRYVNMGVGLHVGNANFVQDFEGVIEYMTKFDRLINLSLKTADNVKKTREFGTSR